MDPEIVRIFRLIETADNFVKYASPGREERAGERALARYERALELAGLKGDHRLVEQIRLRIDDLSQPGATGGTGARDADGSETGARASARAAAVVERDADIRLPESELRKARPSDSVGAVAQDSPVQPRPGSRVPPGQRVTKGWPVLHEGPIPPFDRHSWRLLCDGACLQPFGLSYDELKALPNTELRSDFHCVTGWSKLDNTWRGVSTKVLLERAQPAPGAAYVLVHAERGYTANLPLDALGHENVMVAWSHNGEDLTPEHGFPLRLLVPRLYGWKSVKWVRRIELLTEDKRGFWETRGYHNRADPWREERYAYQEG
jgi:DMSO/TMAO reductase YedYZ molybdopterin-dependent catalytic subunit